MAHDNGHSEVGNMLVNYVLDNKQSSAVDLKHFHNTLTIAVKKGEEFNDLVKLIVSSSPNSADAGYAVKIEAEEKNYSMVFHPDASFLLP